jgi:hypothetical protein
MIHIYDGDKVKLAGTTYVAEEGVLVVQQDDRTPLEKRLDKIEKRLLALELDQSYRATLINPVPPNDPPYTYTSGALTTSKL